MVTTLAHNGLEDPVLDEILVLGYLLAMPSRTTAKNALQAQIKRFQADSEDFSRFERLCGMVSRSFVYFFGTHILFETFNL
jgi:hypothetical protein